MNWTHDSTGLPGLLSIWALSRFLLTYILLIRYPVARVSKMSQISWVSPWYWLKRALPDFESGMGRKLWFCWIHVQRPKPSRQMLVSVIKSRFSSSLLCVVSNAVGAFFTVRRRRSGASVDYFLAAGCSGCPERAYWNDLNRTVWMSFAACLWSVWIISSY